MVDFLVLGAYLAAMIGVGIFFSFRNKNSDDFFRGGQRVPWFVAGLSIFATMLSSVTFIAIPAKAYMTNWVYFLVNMMAVLVTPAVVYVFLPFFRNIDATSAYEYLEKRFNRCIRLFASGSFIIFQIGLMAIVMYLPALAISAITPLSEIQCILLMGLLSVIYCTMGGLEAVVWTDTIQSFILLGGPLFCILLILYRLDGGIGQFVSMSMCRQQIPLGQPGFFLDQYDDRCNMGGSAWRSAKSGAVHLRYGSGAAIYVGIRPSAGPTGHLANAIAIHPGDTSVFF